MSVPAVQSPIHRLSQDILYKISTICTRLEPSDSESESYGTDAYDSELDASDLTRKIFALSISSRIPYDRLYSYRRPPRNDERVHCPALILTWVCSYWRTILQCNVRFWSSISLEADIFIASPYLQPLFMHYLTLSNGAPLILRFSIQSRFPPGPVQEVFYTLLKHSRNWRNVELHFDFIPAMFVRCVVQMGGADLPTPDQYQYTILGGNDADAETRLAEDYPDLKTYIAGDLMKKALGISNRANEVSRIVKLFPLLETLTLRLEDTWPIVARFSIVDLLSRMPALRELNLKSFHVLQDQSDLKREEKNTDLHSISTNSVHSGLEVFSPSTQIPSNQITSLSLLVTTLDSFKPSSDAGAKSVPFPHLQTLELRGPIGMDWHTAENMFPSIHKFSQFLLGGSPAGGRIGGCQLKIFKVNDIPASLIIQSFLYAHPTIKELVFISFWNDYAEQVRPLMTELSLPNSDSTYASRMPFRVLPKLHSLKLIDLAGLPYPRGCGTHKPYEPNVTARELEQEVCGMVESRLTAGLEAETPTTVTLEMHWDWADVIHARLELLGKAGLVKGDSHQQFIRKKTWKEEHETCIHSSNT